MYTVKLFDFVMMAVMGILLIAFFTSLAWSLASVKIKALVTQNDELYTRLHEALPFKYAVQDISIINWCFDPNKRAYAQLADLITVCEGMALDPAISRGANQLINKAKREHGKKIRKAADRKMERVEREYEQRIKLYKDSLESAQGSNNVLRANLGEIRAELTAFQSIVGQELENFVRLPSVRRKMLEAINLNHQAWKDL